MSHRGLGRGAATRPRLFPSTRRCSRAELTELSRLPGGGLDYAAGKIPLLTWARKQNSPERTEGIVGLYD